MALFHLTLLGGFELRTAAGVLVRLPTRKAEALLAYIAAESPQAHRREALAGLLWGHGNDQSALASLRQTLSLIGKVSPQRVLLITGRSVALAPGVMEVDAVEFDAAASSPDIESLRRAADLYRGELLAGMAVNEPAFEDWMSGARARSRERAIQLLGRLAEAQQASGEIERALQTCLRLLEIDPLLESGHRSLMSLYALQGRRAAALRQYQVCVNVLQRELGAEPELPTRQLYNALLRQQHADSSGAAPGLALAGQLAHGVAPPVDAPVHEAPLIGRDAELSQLVAALGGARLRLPQVIAVLGEAGIGKTRLVEEVSAQATTQGLRVLVARGHDSQQLFPLAPWVDMFRTAGVAADTALMEALDPAWRVELANLLPELTARHQSVDDESAAPARQARLFESVVQLLLLMASRPTLLLFEDLHWCDETSLRLLAMLARRGQAWPLTIVVTARDEEVSESASLRRALRELAQGPRFRRVEPRPLTQHETASMVHSLLSSGADTQSSARLADRVWKASEGNPFVVVEAMRAIGAGQSHVDDATLALPERVRDLIKSRMELLSPLAHQLAAVLAVAGRDTDFALLQLATGRSESEAADALEELVRRRMLRLVGESFDFTHARIRQAVSDELLEPTRRALHLALAQAFEQLHANDLSMVNDRLAFHYAHTRQHAKAVVYLSGLAVRASHDGAHDQALMALDQALDHLARGHARGEERARRELVLRQARSLFFLGRFNDALAVLLPEQAGVDGAADPRQAAHYYLRLGSTRAYLGEHVQAMDDAHRALHESTACGDRATMGKAHFLLALEHFWARPMQGVQHGQQAVALLEDTTEHWWLGQAYWILGLNLSYRGRFVEALAMEARARALAEEATDRRLASYAAWATGFIHTLAGELDEAISACRLSVELALDPLNRMTALGMLGLALITSGDAAEALAVLAEAIPQAEQFRIPQMHGLFLTFRGEAQLQLGDLEAARQQAAQGADISRRAGYEYALGWSQRVLGRVAMAEGKPGQAHIEMTQAIATFDAMGAPFEAGRTRLELAACLDACSRDDQG